MNAKRQIQALNNYKWGEKSQKQVATYVGKKLDMLGYKVPKYLKEGKITQLQLDTQLNKIYNKLEKIQEKQYFNSLSRSEQNKIRNERKLEKAIIDYNVKIAKYKDKIMDNETFSDKMKDYLLGKPLTLNSRDKTFFNENALTFIDKNTLNFKNVNNEIKRIKSLTKGLNDEYFRKLINDASLNDSLFFDELLNSDILKDLEESEKEYIKQLYNQLNSAQKSLFIKDRLSQLRETYEKMKEENPDIFDYNNTAKAIIAEIERGVAHYGEF